MLRSKTIIILVSALVLVVAADLIMSGGAAADVTLTDRLAVAPVEDGVYILGNSMFKTGVDLQAMQSQIPERDVRFNYYDGHYTSLWYLIAKGALAPSSERPSLVVWGFRPAYALIPPFRQNRPNSTELFVFPDLAYERLTSDTVAKPLFDLQLLLDNWSGVYSQRENVHDAVLRMTERAGLETLDAIGQDTSPLRDRLIDGDRTIADEVVAAATGGEVELTEEQVVDGVGDFITGPATPFSEGFIPLTANAFQEAGINQLVVIWRPIIAASGETNPIEDEFVSDAIEYFESRGIPYVDLYHNDQIVPSMYGKGDHYNADGRALITNLLSERIRDMLSV